MTAKREKIVFSVPIIIENDNGEFYAYCPALKGLHTSGGTVEEARENAKNAVAAYLLSLIKHGEPIPVGIIKKEKTAKAY